MRIRDLEVTLLDGTVRRFGDLAPGAALVVNVASKCGFTPQYEGLEALHREYGPRGLAVIGMPCNQFMKQEPGTADEIGEFCKVNYGVTFPLLAKGRVNGRQAEPLFRELKRAKDAQGLGGPVLWNFEKFLIGADSVDRADRADRADPDDDGRAVSLQRFRSATKPEDPVVLEAIEAALAAARGRQVDAPR